MATPHRDPEYRRLGVIVAIVAIALVLAFAFGIPRAIEQSADSIHGPGPGPAAVDATPEPRRTTSQ